MRSAVPDLVSNSYFPAIAAVQLGYLRDEGLAVDLDLMFPVTDAAHALRNGDIDFLAGAAHAPFYADPDWSETKLLVALSHNMYWFLVVDPKLDITRDTLAILRNVRIGAAPGVDPGLRQLLKLEGINVAESGITIAPVPGADAGNVSFGVTAAEALQAGRIDAFWANGMGAEVAVRNGVGKILVDARRDGGAEAAFTFPALMTSHRTMQDHPAAAGAAARAIMRAQRELRAAPDLAFQVGRELFPEMEAGLITEVISRDLDYYDPSISPESVQELIDFAAASDLGAGSLDYGRIVAESDNPLWKVDR